MSNTNQEGNKGSEKQLDDQSSSDADHSSQSPSHHEHAAEDPSDKKEETPQQQQNDDHAGEQPSQTDIANAWTTAWDEASRSYYWWNMITYETMWENPYEQKSENASTTAQDTNTPAASPMVPQDASQVPSAESSDVDRASSVEPMRYPDTEAQYSGYAYQAYFNARTGRFQTASEVERLNPERMSIESRAKRQMQYYFDVDAYMEQRNRERAAAGQKRPLTKREIEKFKQAKLEKKKRKARSWLCD